MNSIADTGYQQEHLPEEEPRPLTLRNLIDTYDAMVAASRLPPPQYEWAVGTERLFSAIKRAYGLQEDIFWGYPLVLDELGVETFLLRVRE